MGKYLREAKLAMRHITVPHVVIRASATTPRILLDEEGRVEVSMCKGGDYLTEDDLLEVLRWWASLIDHTLLPDELQASTIIEEEEI